MNQAIPLAVLTLVFVLSMLVGLAKRRSAPVMIGLIVVCIGAGAWSAIHHEKLVASQTPVTNRPIEVQNEGEVSSRTCRACHPREYDTWHESYHHSMTQLATPETIIAPFENVTIDFNSKQYHLDRDGDQFWVDFENPDRTGRAGEEERIKRPIVMTTGSHHMQIYWYATGKTRKLGQFPFVYLIKDQRWVPRNSAFLRPPAKMRASETGRWNATCIQCHTVQGAPRAKPHWDSDSDNMDTQVAEFGIACQACHGPAEQHVKLNRNPNRRYKQYLDDTTDDTIVNPKRLAALNTSKVCGQCHSIWRVWSDSDYQQMNDHGFPFWPDAKLEEIKLLIHPKRVMNITLIQEALEADPHMFEDLFWPDGMPRVTGREYTSMIESPCYAHKNEAKGIMSCLSCHQMHKPSAPEDPREMKEWANDQLRQEMQGNRACTQCHEGFDTDAKLTAHTHHDKDSSGSRCYNCHMPYTSYGLLGAIRTHLVDSPTVQNSLETGRPNACNQCHLDRTLAWSSDHLKKWYDTKPPPLTNEQQTTAASIAWLLKGDANQRALIAWSFGWDKARQASGYDWMPPYLAQLLVDPYHAVRYIAQRSLRRINGYDELKYDYIGEPSDLRAGRRRVLDIWIANRPPASDDDRSQLLLDTDGALQQDRFNHLLGQRNNRRVNLAE